MSAEGRREGDTGPDATVSAPGAGVEAASAAIIAYVHWGTAKTPQADRDAVRALAPAGQADALLAAVHTAVAASEAIEVDAGSPSDPEIATAYLARLREALPGISEDAIRALGSRRFFLERR